MCHEYQAALLVTMTTQRPYGVGPAAIDMDLCGGYLGVMLQELDVKIFPPGHVKPATISLAQQALHPFCTHWRHCLLQSEQLLNI